MRFVHLDRTANRQIELQLAVDKMPVAWAVGRVQVWGPRRQGRKRYHIVYSISPTCSYQQDSFSAFCRRVPPPATSPNLSGVPSLSPPSLRFSQDPRSPAGIQPIQTLPLLRIDDSQSGRCEIAGTPSSVTPHAAGSQENPPPSFFFGGMEAGMQVAVRSRQHVAL